MKYDVTHLIHQYVTNLYNTSDDTVSFKVKSTTTYHKSQY